jgi:hypothetical protein
MKRMPVLCLLSIFVSVASAGDRESSGARDEAKKAIEKLAELDNYSWTSERKSAGNDSSAIKGKINKEGLTYVRIKMADRVVEGLIKDGAGALKSDEGWLSTSEFSGSGGSPRSNPMTFLARHLSVFAKSPVVQASGLLKQTNGLRSERTDVFTGVLNEDGVKENLPQFGVEVSDPEGSVKFWIADGMLVKYSYTVRAHVKFVDQQREVDYDRTTMVEIEDAGTTKLIIPDDVLKKIQ